MLADIQNQLWNLIIPPRSDLDWGHFGEADVDILLLFCKIPPSPRFFSRYIPLNTSISPGKPGDRYS